MMVLEPEYEDSRDGFYALGRPRPSNDRDVGVEPTIELLFRLTNTVDAA